MERLIGKNISCLYTECKVCQGTGGIFTGGCKCGGAGISFRCPVCNADAMKVEHRRNVVNDEVTVYTSCRCGADVRLVVGGFDFTITSVVIYTRNGEVKPTSRYITVERDEVQQFVPAKLKTAEATVALPEATPEVGLGLQVPLDIPDCMEVPPEVLARWKCLGRKL